ncbi:MAG: hypothetical protein WC848_02130 [Parcubacteria group bacterium]|jgi:hypothetical protein
MQSLDRMADDKSRLDEEVFVKIFQNKTHCPEVISRNLFEKLQETDPDAKKYFLRSGVLSALHHSSWWNHDHDLRSIENVVWFCLERELYGKTLEAAIDLVTSREVTDEINPESVDYQEVCHTIGHFYEHMYDTGRIDLVNKLNSYTVKIMISAKSTEYGGGNYLNNVCTSPITNIICDTGENPFPFKGSAFDNEEFLELIKAADSFHRCAYDDLMEIKRFDEEAKVPPVRILAEPENMVDGVFVDVDGTLVVGANQLNQFVVDLLKKYKESGKAVTVFTAGNIYSQKTRLERLGLTEIIGEFEVRAKSDFTGQKLEIVIDDFTPKKLRDMFGIFIGEHILP